MLSQNDKYKVVSSYGAVFVTYNDLEKARTFVKNIYKARGLKLYIKDNEQNKGGKNVKT